MIWSELQYCVFFLLFANVEQVGEIRSLVSDPVYECVTREEEICHAGHITEYTPVKESRCEEVYEKKCDIQMVKVTVNETIRTCSKPLKRVCRVRRDTLQTRVRPLGALLEETVTKIERSPTARSLDSLLSLTQEESEVTEECRIYLETVCVTEAECHQLPVRVCAYSEGCGIEEGEEMCETSAREVARTAPRELCAIIPRNVCRRITKLVPRLIEQVSLTCQHRGGATQ